MKRFKKALALFFLLFFIFCLSLHLSQNSYVGTLTITGKKSQEEISWQNPSFPPQKEILSTHEIFFTFANEPPIEAFIWGDLIGIRYRLLEFKSLFRWMGCKDFIEIEALCSDYVDLEKKAKYPSKLISLSKNQPASFASLYRSIWKKLFFETSGNFFIKRATLEVTYLPLERSQTFIFYCKDGKLIIQ